MVYTRSEREINMISKSCQIVADTIEMLSEYVIAGVSLLDLDHKAEEYIISCGARPALRDIWDFPLLCVYLLMMLLSMVSLMMDI